MKRVEIDLSKFISSYALPPGIYASIAREIFENILDMQLDFSIYYLRISVAKNSPKNFTYTQFEIGIVIRSVWISSI